MRGWRIPPALLEAYARAAREGLVLVSVNVGAEDADRTVYTVGGTGGNPTGLRIDAVIIDDPWGDEHTYEGEFHVVPPREAMSEMAKMIKFDEALPSAQSTVKNRGPQPRTKYPRRR